MCSIAGLLNLPVSELTVDRMKKTMVRRGPDEFGMTRFNELTLLHCRLSVIDPTGGKQPMSFRYGQERYTIVYNGELYNTDELRKELTALGHQFTGHSDTEVLLHGYSQWGRGILEKCNGIFAFAVWEENSRRLFLARDRIGVKPLFFVNHLGGIIFASELKTILAYPGFRPVIDVTGCAEILLLGPGRTPGCGVFRGIRELEPGCWCAWQDGRLEKGRYWKLTDAPHKDRFQETVEKVRWLVTDAIRRQMVSDVPIGTFLSGGLDSSLISSVCASEMKKQGKILETFSVDYEHNDQYFRPGKYQPNMDSDYIGVMEAWLGTHPNRVVLTADQLSDGLEEAVIARDLPGMADVDISLLLFCRQIRQKVTVALSGECADELFGGYPWYRDPAIRDSEGFPWAQSTRMRTQLLNTGIREKMDANEYIMSRYRKTVEESDIMPDSSPLERRMKQMMNLNFRWFMQTLLDRKDRMSMYSSLEVRVPFCDWRIAEYLYRVPWEMKEAGGVEKGMLRHAAKGLLPDDVLWRKKSPYPKTYDPRYLSLMKGKLNRLLADRYAPIWQLIRPDMVRILTGEDYEWPWYGQLMNRPQTICYLLQVDFWLRHYHVDIRI